MTISIDNLDEPRALVELLGSVARAAHNLADGTCENAQNGEHTAEADLFERLGDALDACEHLPEPEEGYVSDGWCWALRRLRQLIDETEQREQALAAHLEALTAPSVELASTVENRDDLPIHQWAMKCARLVTQVQQAANDTPTTSLARRDALKRAEALEWAVRHIKDGMAREFLASNLADIECEADMSRRRAEESPHG